MEKLLINASGLVANFLEKYQIWKDYNKFYNDDNHVSMVEINPHGIPVFHYQDIDKINKSTSSLIAIDCVSEGLHSHPYFSQYSKNKHYIIFSNGIWLKDTIDFGISYDLVSHLFGLFEMADTYLSPNRFCFYLDKDYKFDYPKPCIFTSTVGNVRPERDYVVGALTDNLTYKNFILRYSGQNFGITADQFDMIQFRLGQFDPYIHILEKYYHNVCQTLPIQMYNQSYFNLVVETEIDYADNFFLTEKTIKTLLTGMPFVVVSTPNFLKNLQQLGFTTYNELWNESYDSILDYKNRIDAIVDLCNNLGQFDWESNKSRLAEIQLKNRNNFFNLNRVARQEFKNFENIIKQL